jgi:excisionase family DNA binding protein
MTNALGTVIARLYLRIMSTTEKRLLNTDEVAAIFGVRRRTVLRWAGEGLIPRVQIAGTTRYRAEDVERLITSANDERPAVPGEALETTSAAGGVGGDGSGG